MMVIFANNNRQLPTCITRDAAAGSAWGRALAGAAGVTTPQHASESDLLRSGPVTAHCSEVCRRCMSLELARA